MNWSDIPEQAKDDLVYWFNTSHLEQGDKRRLAKLYADGLFHAWDCPTCGERVYHGEPKDWDNFQGVREMDTCSYPGRPEVFQAEIIEKQCDHCRCYLNPTLGDWPNREDTGL